MDDHGNIYNRYNRKYILIISNVDELNILNFNIQSQRIEAQINYEFKFDNIQKSLQIASANLNLINYYTLQILIESQKYILIKQINFFFLISKFVLESSIQFQSENIQINNFDFDILYENNIDKDSPLINFIVNNLAIETLNIIKIINLRKPLLQVCNLSQNDDEYMQVTVDSVILQQIIQNQIPTSASSQDVQSNIYIHPFTFNFFNQFSIQKKQDQSFAFFDFRRDTQQPFKQKILFNRIEFFTYQVYNALFIDCQNFEIIIIDQLIFHENAYSSGINIWNSQGMFYFDGSSFDYSELQINNIDLRQINFISSSNGIFYTNKFTKVSINNTTLSSSQNFQSSQGTLFTFLKTNQINIFNLSATIYPSCQFQSLYGGLIFMDNLVLASISNLKFNYLEQFKEVVQHIGLQGGIIYTNNAKKVIFQSIKAYGAFSSSADGAFAYIISLSLELQDIIITKFTSQKSGGAFFIRSKASLYDVNLIENKSYFTGGALHIQELLEAQNVLIEKNESLFGGGIYFSEYYLPQNITFKNNIGLIRGNDYSYYILEIRLMQLFEYNSQLYPPYQVKNYQMKEIEYYSYYTDFVFNTFTYFVTIKFRMYGENEWIEYINNDQIMYNGYNDLTSILYCNQQLNNKEIIIKQNISQNLNQFFYSFSVQLKSKTNEFFGQCSTYGNIYFSLTSKINDNCSNGMIQQTLQSIPYCQYCIDSVVFNTQANNPSAKCLSCSREYFDLCQADYSSLKQGFWRQNPTVDSSQIFACSINKFNCLGGNFTGNQLCAKGHIGVECQECDLNNVRGDGKFTRKNIYQCSECDLISYNIIRIIFLVLAIFVVILIIFKTNYRQQKNFIYMKYLSDMKMLYLGKSYYRLGQSGSYIKILSFYFQIINISSQLYGTQSWINVFSFQQSFYNPITDSAFSLDCFLSSFTNNSNSVTYQKIVILTIAPFIFVALSLIPSIFQLFKSKYKRFQYSASLIISYGFTNLFIIPVIDVLISGMLCKTFYNGESYSILDFNTNCNDSDRLVFIFAFIIPFLLIYSIIIPGVLFYYLYKNRDNLDKISCRFLLGFLYADYRKKYFYWEYIRLAIKFTLIVAAYGFLSSPLLLGFVSLAILILYLIFLVKKQPYITRKLNEIEVKSIVIGCQYLIAYMISFSLYQQEIAYKNSFDQYNLISTILLFLYNLISILFIAYMAGQIFVSMLYPHIYKLKKFRCFNFLLKYLKVLRFKQYTENKRKNLIKLRNLAKQIVQNNFSDFIFFNQNEIRSQQDRELVSLNYDQKA
ncbi:transmembrane protein, putative (macronuclear) [Tetrahymena thermophila SB210]|uniref:Transmembrane protein, putative n=1 Tax=Tetrahymena thermophila (strain SB210) TaxID=312017 RepID=Q23BR2_TETTS|nr:transmembrane protein, putative [Tetrahymena thermophila SB210]EAR94056.2 transmembrane protein, putative [Tetrahymena thermophila SB210]|eukprot:XP_001014301.2 transmembrane protein, putative [Tetrahymena thermophila SB210]